MFFSVQVGFFCAYLGYQAFEPFALVVAQGSTADDHFAEFMFDRPLLLEQGLCVFIDAAQRET